MQVEEEINEKAKELSAIGKGQFYQLGRESRNPTRENSTLSFVHAPLTSWLSQMPREDMD